MSLPELPEATMEEWLAAIQLPDKGFVEFIMTHSLAAIWDQLPKADLSWLPTQDDVLGVEVHRECLAEED